MMVASKKFRASDQHQECKGREQRERTKESVQSTQGKERKVKERRGEEEKDGERKPGQANNQVEVGSSGRGKKNPLTPKQLSSTGHTKQVHCTALLEPRFARRAPGPLDD